MDNQSSGPLRGNGLKTLLGGLALLVLVVVALLVIHTFYVWPAILGAVLSVAGIVMMIMKK